MPANQTGRGLTAASFASLMTRLGPDAERAGVAYEHLRRALVGFFSWRGAAAPEECADETLDRLARQLDQGVAVQDLPRFARGIARLVLLEHWRRPGARDLPLDALQAGHPAAPERADDGLAECLDRCLAELPSDGRELILAYYGGESGRPRIEARRRLAQALGVSESALRNRAQRLRDRLEECISRRGKTPPLAPTGDTK